MFAWMNGSGLPGAVPIGVNASQASALDQLCLALQQADRGAPPSSTMIGAGLAALSALRSQTGIPAMSAWSGAVATTAQGGSTLTLRHAPSALELAAHIDASGRVFMATLAWVTPTDVANPIGLAVLGGSVARITGSAGQVDTPLGAVAPRDWTDAPTFAPSGAGSDALGGGVGIGVAAVAAGALGAIVAAAVGRPASAPQSPGTHARTAILDPPAGAPLPAPRPGSPPHGPAPTVVASETLVIDDTKAAHPSARLVWVTGPRAGAECLIREYLYIGRGHDQDIDLDGIEPKASRKHAVVYWAGGDLLVKDTGSQNGTGLNGRKVLGATRLCHGDVLSVGAMKWRVDICPG